jgi:ABC-2 type transport system permease protein
VTRQLSPSLPVESLPMRPVAPPAGDFLPPEHEARAFWRLRRRLAVTTLRQAFARARFRLTLILVLSMVLWLGLFWLFADGFRFLRSGIVHAETHDQMVRAVFGMFFAALMVMLVFSSAIILYGSLFRSREIAFLLTIPARTERVFLHKFQEALLLSSWGFLLMGSPMLLAYGVVARAPWYYFAMLPPFMAAFVYIPGGIAAVLCLGVVRHLPGKRLHVLILGGALLVGGGVWIICSLLTSPQNDLLTPGWFQEISARLSFSQRRLLPSWWLSSGLLEAARNQWSEGVLFLVVMIANALFCRQLAVWTAARIYRAAYSTLAGRHVGRKRAKPAWIDRAAFGLTGLLPRQMQLLMVKDLRLFRRDPAQWSQFLIFFGLLALYFLNIRRFSYNIHYVGWVNMVSFLNLSVVGLLMSTFTTRFIFPMISLEGRRFWLLGLLPLRRERLLLGKFLFAAGGSIVPCAALILLSDVMLNVLRISPIIVASHQLTCAILCLGLSGIAVGLGARLPNLREESPARIAAGFGGTLSLVISTLYILAVVLLTALPCHFYLAAYQARSVRVPTAGPPIYRWLEFWLVAGTVGSVLLGVLATVIPLRMGFRAFRRLEF